MLKWYRSYPSLGDIAELENKGPLPAHIQDQLPRLYVSGYKYLEVDWPLYEKPGFCMLEWDIALDPWAMRQFASIALEEPREILVSPYRYHDTWCMWKGNNGGGPTLKSRPIKRGQKRTDSFGLGCIYIPSVILAEFLSIATDFSDATFGMWYHEKYGQARVTWKVHPQHLHEYPM